MVTLASAKSLNNLDMYHIQGGHYLQNPGKTWKTGKGSQYLQNLEK